MRIRTTHFRWFHEVTRNTTQSQMKPTAKQKKYIVALGGFLGKAATRQEASSTIDSLQNDAMRARQDLNSRWGAEPAMREQLERIKELGAVPVANATMTAAAMQIDGLVRALKAEEARIAAQKHAEFEANPFWQLRQRVDELLKRRTSLQERRADGKRRIAKLKNEAERIGTSTAIESEQSEDRIIDLEMEQDPIEDSISSIEDELEDLKDELRLAVRLREDFWLACFGKDFMGEYPVDECPNYNPAVCSAADVVESKWQIPARKEVAAVLSDLDQQFGEWDKFNGVEVLLREFEERSPDKRKVARKGIQQARESSVQAAPSKKGCSAVLVVLLLAGGMAAGIYLLQ
jgi:hypothetical protein